MQIVDFYNYENSVDNDIRKQLDIYYTPLNVAITMVFTAIDNYIEQNGLQDKRKSDVLDMIKIFDPCTGSGVLIYAFVTVANVIYRMDNRNDFDVNEYFKHHIYAVDIDEKAVNVAKEILKSCGVTQEVVDNNIVCGDVILNEYSDNRLVPKYGSYENLFWDVVTHSGYEMDFEFNSDESKSIVEIYNAYKEETNADKKEALRIELYSLALEYNGIYEMRKSCPFICEIEFMDVFLENGGFDIVIETPPYISVKPCTFDRLKRFKSFGYGLNFGAYFYEYGFELLNKNGIEVVLSENYWLHSRSANNFRNWLEDGNKLKRLAVIKESELMLTGRKSGVNISILSKSSKDEFKLVYCTDNDFNHNIACMFDGKETSSYNEILIDGNEIEKGLKKKYYEAQLQAKVGDYCRFRPGISLGSKSGYDVDSSLLVKYPGLIKRAISIKNINSGKDKYIAYIPSGIYKDFKTLPEEIQNILLENKNELEVRKEQFKGSEWYSVKPNKEFDEELNVMIVSNDTSIKILELDASDIVVDNNIICGECPTWIQCYLDSRIVNELFNICSSSAINQKNFVPLKTSTEVNNIPIPCDLIEMMDISDEDIIDAFELTDDELGYLGYDEA